MHAILSVAVVAVFLIGAFLWHRKSFPHDDGCGGKDFALSKFIENLLVRLWKFRFGKDDLKPQAPEEQAGGQGGA